jgi:hypothetical protein
MEEITKKLKKAHYANLEHHCTQPPHPKKMSLVFPSCHHPPTFRIGPYTFFSFGCQKKLSFSLPAQTMQLTKLN